MPSDGEKLDMSVHESDRPSEAEFGTAPAEGPDQFEELIASPEFARALETDSFKRFLDCLPIAVAISKLVRGEQRIVYANQAFEKLFGQSLPEIKGRNWSILDNYRHRDDPSLSLGRAILRDEDFLGSFWLDGQDGAMKGIEAAVALIEREGERERFRLAAFFDCSHRELVLRAGLEKDLRAKDLLLKELQHRVKNSLQIITALIRLEAREVRQGDRARFETVAARVEALGILYQAMSTQPSPGEIDLGAYLSQIASGVLRSHATDGVRLDVLVDCCPALMKVAMSVGLLVNEILLNALKHAFVGRDGGTVTLRCLRKNETCEIVVADDGVGLPAGVEWPARGKIGALMAESLSENGNATLVVDSRPGRGVRITFEVPLASASRTGGEAAGAEQVA